MNITDEIARDWLITAVEGGINYWAAVNNYDFRAGKVTVHEYADGAPDFRMCELLGIPIDEEPVATYEVDLETIKRGIKLWMEKFCKCIHDVEDDYDAMDADAALQLAILGEVRFG